MNKNEKKLLTWKETLKLNLRTLKLLYKEYPQMVLSRFINEIWKALSPYIEIYFSALIIEELAGQRNLDRLKLLVLITLISTAVIAMISALLEKWKGAGGFYTLMFREADIFAKKLLQMDFVNVDDTKTSELLSTIQQNRNIGGWGLIRVLSNCEKIISSIFIFAGGISLTISLFTSKVSESNGAYSILNSPVFVLLVVVIMLAITYLSPYLLTKANRYFAKIVSVGTLGNRLFFHFGNLGFDKEMATDVRIYRQDKICTKYHKDKHGIFGSQGQFAKLCRGSVGLYTAASSAVSVIFTGVVYAFVCLKAWAGAFGVGAVTQYIASITKVSGGVSSFLYEIGDMRNNAVFLKTVYEYLDIPNDMYQGSLTVEKRIDRDYEVEFKNVSFKYPGSDSFVLKNINMKFKIGERLAVVGMNGSGKTTFIKLLCRLYDPTEGEILLNGINIRKYNYQEYLSIFSIVFQDFKLFAFPLAQNVAASTEYDIERVTKCLQKAGFGERLAEMPEGVETYLYKNLSKKGVDISGGEAQKIALARTLYKDAPFIILDEPTAALDPIAEAEVYSKFNEIVGDKTAVYISHRLSSCRFCDEIVVFDQGQIVQQGSHERLVVEESGKYYELWNAQAQYYT